MYPVNCGVGSQKIRWLADVAIHRFDPEYAFGTGVVHELRMENGVLLNMRGTISDELQDDVHVFVQLFDDWNLQQKMAESKKGRWFNIWLF